LPAKKAGRQSLKRHKRNTSVRTATRTGVAKALRSIETGDAAVADGVVRDAVTLLDLAARKGVMHKNTVARRKSRIAARLNKLESI
jgi:small subunit ribosomal protein S20